MKAFLRFALLLVLTACGGGSMEVTNKNADGSIILRPAKTVIAMLEATADAELADKVQSLHGKFGDNLKWSEFWKELSGSPVKTRLIPAHRDGMLTLQIRSCDDEGFAAYVAFIVNIGDGFEYVLGANRVCPTQLSAAQTMTFLRSFHQADLTRRSRPDTAALTVAALNEQLSHEPGAGWETLITVEDSSWIRAALQTIINSPAPAASMEFARKFMAATGGLAFADVFGPKLFNDAAFLQQVLTEHGRTAALQLLSDVAGQPGSGAIGVAQGDIDRLEKFLLTNGIQASTGAEEAWGFFLQTRRTLLTLYNSKTLAEKLPMHERLQRELEAFMREQPANALNSFLETKLQASSTTSSLAEVVWLAFRLVQDVTSPIGVLTAQRVNTLQSSLAVAPLDQILLRRIAVHFAPGMRDRRERAAEFCSALQVNGINESNITESAFIDHLQTSPIAGCFSVETDGVVALNSATALRTSFNSFYSLPDTNIQLTAPSVELSMLDTSATKVHPLLQQLPMPADPDALTLPVLVGILLHNNQTNLQAGTHYFVANLTLRKAKDGAVDARVPASGFDGGDVVVRANAEPMRYALISFATAGQQSPPVPPAGQGDSSTGDPNLIAPFLANLPEHNGYTHPYRFHGAIPVGKLRTLLDKGAKALNQTYLAVDIPHDYPTTLKLSEADKLRAFCATAQNPNPTLGEIGKYMADHYRDEARNLMFTTVQAFEALPGTGPTTEMPEFSIFNPFTLPAGKAGVVKPKGADGEVGEAKFIAL